KGYGVDRIAACRPSVEATRALGRYPDHDSSDNLGGLPRMFTPELLDGARNLIINYGGIKAGDEVIILAEFGHCDQAVADVEAAVCTEVGAKPHTIWTPELRKTWWEDLSAVTRGAIGAADVMVQNVGTIGRTHLLDLMLNNGVRRVRNYATDV